MASVNLVFANGNMARYPQGGGHWSVRLQYLKGAQELGYGFFWIELMKTSGDRAVDERRTRLFFRRFESYGLRGRCALLLFPFAEEPLPIERAEIFGATRPRLMRIIKDADMVWNFCCAARKPLLSLFSRKVLIDLDPGHLHVSALEVDLDINEHDAFLTVGTNLHGPDCEVPTLGKRWHPFLPPIHPPIWPEAPGPAPDAPITSVTHWTWDELRWRDRPLSVSKRDAYLRYLELPLRSGVPFELAVHLHPRDRTGDRELLKANGWRLVHPYRVTRAIGAYQRYIRGSRAEFGCAKPIHAALRTGWFSDRSAAYLASGRPVLAEDTGFGRHLPTGEGLVTFRDLEEAREGVRRIVQDYPAHRRAARRLALEFLDARRVLPKMVEACA